MFRAIFELIVVILIVMVARVVLNSLIRGVANPTLRSRSRDPNSQADPGLPRGSELHKDPVCGTYVAESTPFQRQIAGQSFYYCSESCREKHALVAR